MNQTELAPGDANGTSHEQLPTSDADTLIPNSTVPLEALCSRVHARIIKFLEQDPESELLRNVQAKTREALQVIDKALDTYR